MSTRLSDEAIADLEKAMSSGDSELMYVTASIDNMRALLDHCTALEEELKGRVDPSKPFRGANCLEKPERLAGQPIGQYHCPYCGMMLIAGLPHDEPDEDNPDYELLKELEPALQITEAEAEEALRAEGTSGKEVVNRFIERLLHERSKLQEELKAAQERIAELTRRQNALKGYSMGNPNL